MDTQRQPAPLVVIVGETGSGKSVLALELAEKYQGEIICADSRTVYRGMDIGTAKPTPAERTRVPHHLLDLVEPGEAFNAARFKELALEAIADITCRGKLPFLVGGTGLYIDAVIFDYAFLPSESPEERDYLNNLSTEQLQQLVRQKGLQMPANANNPRHLIRAIETNGAVPVRKGLRANTLVLGLSRSKTDLQQRLEQRTATMIRAGLEGEARVLADRYDWDGEAMKAVGYREWQAYIAGQQSLDETKKTIQHNSMMYAKRQRTWFKRNESIQWIHDYAEAEKLVARFLHKRS